ncbi:MAG: tryptophan synthase subunit alpha [Cytophagaceae bacterium]|nr:tryptophan synthase subunit alpha [Cytophagaceae bacterium]
MTNRIIHLLQVSPKNLLSIYFTAGFPQLGDTRAVLKALQESGADLVEIGIPFSDPIADGETIQQSNQQALDNGMTLKLLFEQLASMRQEIAMPVLLMGYINPVLQFGVEAFCQNCQEVGVDGLILPDMPLEVYEEEYKELFEQYGLLNIFLITPQTSNDRIHQIDYLSDGFIYMVSSASVTGAKSGISDDQEVYFKRVKSLGLKNPQLIGFGISNRETFLRATKHASGAIIGSAFVKILRQTSNLEKDIHTFIADIKNR